MKVMLVGREPLEISLYADSAVGRDVQPLFIPNFGGEWSVTLAPACKVGRLGKSVPVKFASRYIDAVSVVALMHPTGLSPAAGTVPGWLSIMDSAVTAGHWLAANDEWQWTVANGGDIARLPIAAPSADEAAVALSRASAMATLKTGDVIVPPGEMLTLPLAADTIITAAIDGEQVLRLKVK